MMRAARKRRALPHIGRQSRIAYSTFGGKAHPFPNGALPDGRASDTQDTNGYQGVLRKIQKKISSASQSHI